MSLAWDERGSTFSSSSHTRQLLQSPSVSMKRSLNRPTTSPELSVRNLPTPQVKILFLVLAVVDSDTGMEDERG